MTRHLIGIFGLLLVLLIAAFGALFTVYQTQQALVIRFGKPIRIITEPGLHVKVPVFDTVIYINKRILDLENPAQEVFASDQRRLMIDAFARYRIRDPLLFYQRVSTVDGANTRLSSLLNAALRRVLGEATLIHVVRDDRAALMARVRDQLDREARGLGIEVVDGTAAPGRFDPRRGQPEEPGNPRQGRPRRHRDRRRGAVEGRADAGRGRCQAQPHFCRSLRQGPRLLRVLPLDAGL